MLWSSIMPQIAAIQSDVIGRKVTVQFAKSFVLVQIVADRLYIYAYIPFPQSNLARLSLIRILFKIKLAK